MTIVHCNNKQCIFRKNNQCTKFHIDLYILHNKNLDEMYCGSYEKYVSINHIHPDSQLQIDLDK